MGKLFAVVSGKGGTGKSTVAAGLGAALARRGKRVLLIDADEGLRCLDLLLGVAEQTVFDVGDLLLGRCAAADAVYAVPGCAGLFLLAAPAVPGQLRDAELFRRLCLKLTTFFDFVFIDGSAGIDKGFQTVTRCASNVLVVANAEPASLRAAALVNTLLTPKQIAHGRLILNKFNALAASKPDTPNVDDIIDRTGFRLLGLVPQDARVPEAAARGKPLSAGRAKEAFDRIAARLLGESVPLGTDVFAV